MLNDPASYRRARGGALLVLWQGGDNALLPALAPQANTATPAAYRSESFNPRQQPEAAAEAAPVDGDDMATEAELRRAEIAASEARTDTKIVRFEGKLDLVLSKLEDVRHDNRSTRNNQWVIGAGLAVLIVAIVALFPVFFDLGSKVRDLIAHEVRSALGFSNQQ